MNSAGPTASVTRRTLNRLALSCLLAIGLGVLAPAQVFAKYASLVIDADSGKVLHEVNADTRNYPASLTKMMTLYLVFEALEDGRWTMDQKLKVSTRAARQPSSKLALKKGTRISVEDAIMAIITKSANDVATVIAENMHGSERNFALVMTAKARQLGMSRTTFRNASGLPHRGQMSTARDMTVLARSLINDYASYYHYFSSESFTYDGIIHRNHNKLLDSYDGADGIKTGYIRASGFNLVASAKRGVHRLIGVVFGGRSPKTRNRHMARLLDKGFQSLAPKTLVAEKKTKAVTKKVAVAIKKTKKMPAVRTASVQPRKPVAVAYDLATDGQWGVQVGVYTRTSQAKRMAESVLAKAFEQLKDGTAAVVPLKKRKRKSLYRARVVGLTKKDAYEACDELERKGIPCLEVVSRRMLQTASIMTPAKPAAPVAPAVTKTGGQWGIQVGVYADYDPAYAIALKATKYVPNLLEDGHIKVVPLNRGRRKTYHRGRILGISKKLAYQACRTLKRRKLSCMEIKLPEDVELASTAP